MGFGVLIWVGEAVERCERSGEIQGIGGYDSMELQDRVQEHNHPKAPNIMSLDTQ